MVHKPWVDEVSWTRPGEPGVYRRVPEVIDCWFDSGAMPFARFGFPHRNRDRFLASFPADFITEAIDQTRGWFYSLLMISTLLFDEETCGRLGIPAPDGPHPYRSCLVLGHVTDAEGRKESKSRGNYTPPEVTLDEVGADAFRWFFLAGAAPWAAKRHSPANVRAAAREFPLKLRNVVSFFTIYAGIDGFDPRTDEGRPVSERRALDRWILSHLEATTAEVTRALEDLRAGDAGRALATFAESLSNWWLRRSRRRFWASGRSADKLDAYRTLHDTLVRVSRLAAPFTPFLAEDIHANLVAGPPGEEAPESVHLSDWPAARFPLDEALNEEMAAIREIASLGLRVRKEQGDPGSPAARRGAGGGGRPGARGAPRPPPRPARRGTECRRGRFSRGSRGGSRDPGEAELPPPRSAARSAGAGGGEGDRGAAGERGARAPPGGGAPDPRPRGRAGADRRGRSRGHDPPPTGRATASNALATVTLDTALTPALLEEGRYRELLHRVQAFRKELDLPYVARIRVALDGATRCSRSLASGRRTSSRRRSRWRSSPGGSPGPISG